MTRRYTGAEARELAERATKRPGQWGAVGNETLCFLYDGKGAVIASIEGHSKLATGALLAAAPDLAESLAAVEAERDALRVERDAYREYYRARQALITADDADSTSVLFAAEDRVSAARERIAALREAAK